MGTCNGVLSSCALGGYALETRWVVLHYSPSHLELTKKIKSSCHLGKSIVYDTVTNLTWPVDVRQHRIVNVIEELLSNPWPPSIDVGREVPQAKPEVDCVVSFFPFFLSVKNSHVRGLTVFCFFFNRNVIVGSSGIILPFLLDSICDSYYSVLAYTLICFCNEVGKHASWWQTEDNNASHSRS